MLCLLWVNPWFNYFFRHISSSVAYQWSDHILWLGLPLMLCALNNTQTPDIIGKSGEKTKGGLRMEL